MKTILIALITIGLSSCKLSNIYEGISIIEGEKKVETLINETIKTYGEEHEWENVQSVSAIAEDNWPTYKWRLLASPWKNTTTKFKMDWQPNSNNSRVEVLSGPWKGNIVGIQQWSTYFLRDSLYTFKNDKEIRFHLPTMEYFFEFPFRIKEADIVKYGGVRLLDNTAYETVLMSWNTLKPQPDLDQYIIFIHPKTHLIDFIEFTVRDQGRFTYATVKFEDFRHVDGFTLPHRVTAYFQNHPPGKTIGHQIIVSRFSIGKEFTEQHFIPHPEIKELK